MTKQDVLRAIELGQSIPELRYLYDAMIEFICEVGLGHIVEGKDTSQRHKIAHKINRRLVLENTKVRPLADINKLYVEFFSMMVEHETKYTTLDELYSDWDYQLPPGDYMHVPAGPQMDERNRLSPYMDKWSDDQIRRTCGIMQSMGIPFDFGRPDSFHRRIKRELDKRGLAIPTIEIPKGPLAKHL